LGGDDLIIFSKEAPPPGLLAPIGVIRMLSETVPGPPDEGRHLQFENEARRIERRVLPRRGATGAPPGSRATTRRRSARPTCRSPHKHALLIAA